jgi:hypothetical protein
LSAGYVSGLALLFLHQPGQRLAIQLACAIHVHYARISVVQILKAGALYFALVFGAGFLLGPIRILWVVPRFGTRMAELMEMPVMFVVIFLAAQWIIRRLAVPFTPSSRLGMGFIAVGLLLAAEFTLVLKLRGLSISQYLATRDPVSGTVYYAMLGVFAILPLLVAPDRPRK